MGVFQWSCYTSPWGPSTSHPLTVFSSMTAFQQSGEEEEEMERRTMRLAERLEVKGQTALHYTVCEQRLSSCSNRQAGGSVLLLSEALNVEREIIRTLRETRPLFTGVCDSTHQRSIN
ncbi:hypothetical protein PAMA_019678 [Pampus argenteus]